MKKNEFDLVIFDFKNQRLQSEGEHQFDRGYGLNILLTAEGTPFNSILSSTPLDECFCLFGYSQLVGDKQKGEPQNGGNKKTKHAKFSEKRAFLTS